MPFQIIRNDITAVAADAIVNSANPGPLYGRGTDCAIYKAAGVEKLLEKRREIGEIKPGEAAWTPAFNLSAKYIIHTVGPVFGSGEGEADAESKLAACYRNSLRIAGELCCESVAVPLISAGNNMFPKDRALNIAVKEIEAFLENSEMLVILVVFDRESYDISSKLSYKIEEFIDDRTARKLSLLERETVFFENAAPADSGHGRAKKSDIDAEEEADREPLKMSLSVLPAGRSSSKKAKKEILPDACASESTDKELEEYLRKTDLSFQQKLFELIDSKGLSDVEVYKRANIDRKLFSHIRCKPDYRPAKKTAVAFAIALRLSMPETVDLLARAGFALSPGNKFDLIISFFVENGIYDIFEINTALFKYDQPILG